jgi:probable rRNA maturation factor
MSYPKVEISNHYPGLSFSESSVFEFFRLIFSIHQHSQEGTLSVVFLTENQHSEIHGKFLKDFRPTDVITFPADELESSAGEILVSVDQAVLESSSRGLPLEEELSLYLIHGWLHLVGFDDIDLVDRKIIRLEEQRAMDLIRESDAWPDFLLASSTEE